MKTKKKTITAVDLFCGAGGTSTGLIQACEELGYKLDLLAINHWDIAILTHTKNHPGVKHLCTGVDTVNPRDLVRDGTIKQRLDLLLASPECQHHSNARGGRPMSDQKRASAWHILWWAEALDIRNILIENVKEFRQWGPLDSKGRPIPKRKGELFLQFIKNLEALGYKVDFKICNAADYGAATSRERLFMQATKTRKAIKWAEPTHQAKPKETMYGTAQRHRPARDIIDFSIQGRSIYFDPKYIKNPLSPNTIARIYAGLTKYSGLPFLVPQFGGNPERVNSIDNPLPTIVGDGGTSLIQPIIVILKGQSIARSVDEPLRTILTKNHQALIQPFIVVLRNHADAQSLDKPIPTLTTGLNVALAQPYLVKYYQGSDACSVDEPLPTVTAHYEHLGLVQPFIVPIDQTGSNGHCAKSIDDPLHTITTKARTALVEPFLVKYHGNHKGKTDGQNRNHTLEEPLRALDTSNRVGLVEPFLVPVNHTGDNNRTHSVEKPLPTLTTKNGTALVEPFILKFYGNGESVSSIDSPLPTVTTLDRFALVEGFELQEGDELAILDIRFRMLQPDELSRAMSFPPGYYFAGTKKDVVKQIGNAVDVLQAKAHCLTILG